MHPSRGSGVLMQVCRPLPSVNTHRHELSRGDKGLNGRAGLLGLEPEVVARHCSVPAP